MSEYCLDTSAYSRFQAGDTRVVDVIDRAASIGVPSIVIGEMLIGLKLGRQRRANEEALRRFLANPAVEILDVDAEVAFHYSDIYTDLRQKGEPIPTNDIWIAATAARSGMTVVTYDDHFNSISRVGTLFIPDQ